MPGTDCVFEDSINSPLKDVTNFFGFYYCSIITKDNYLGLLPVRSKQGIIMPNGEWSGWYFSEELKFAAEHGYDIYKQIGVFDSYIKYLYNIKSTTQSDVERAISKSLLNNLFGRFGLDITKSKTELLDEDIYNELTQTKSIHSRANIGDKVLVNYSNKVSSTICKQHNVDYRHSMLHNIINNNESEKTFGDVTIAIASAVTSYGTITITKAKLDILKKGGKLYYSDTDSIATGIPLDNELVGDNLGQFKLAETLSRGYFISSKTYFLVRTYGSVIIKAKGENNRKL